MWFNPFKKKKEKRNSKPVFTNTIMAYYVKS